MSTQTLPNFSHTEKKDTKKLLWTLTYVSRYHTIPLIFSDPCLQCNSSIISKISKLHQDFAFVVLIKLFSLESQITSILLN